MNEKEVEQQLVELAEQEEVRDFAEVWEQLEGRITPKETKKKKPRRFIYMVASFAMCLILCCSIGIPLLLNNPTPELVYFFENLESQETDRAGFFNGIDESSVNVVDLTRYEGKYALLVTHDGKIKGGRMEFDTIIGVSGFSLKTGFVSDDVEVNEDIVYDQTCNSNGTVVQYKQISSQNGIYVYNAFTTYQKVQYICEIMTDTQDLTIFFNEFLQS